MSEARQQKGQIIKFLILIYNMFPVCFLFTDSRSESDWFESAESFLSELYRYYSSSSHIVVPLTALTPYEWQLDF